MAKNDGDRPIVTGVVIAGKVSDNTRKVKVPLEKKSGELMNRFKGKKAGEVRIRTRKKKGDGYEYHDVVPTQ